MFLRSNSWLCDLVAYEKDFQLDVTTQVCPSFPGTVSYFSRLYS